MSEYAIIWIILAIALGIIESMTVNLVTIWFAIGAVAAFLSALVTNDILVQLCIFTAVSLLTLVLTRPFAKKLLENKKVATNADRFVGEKAVVTEEIDLVKGVGQVKALGQTWSAKPLNGERIEQGEQVIIDRIEGVRAVVSKEG